MAEILLKLALSTNQSIKTYFQSGNGKTKVLTLNA